MSISYVLRLRSDALADGRFVGEIEAVSDAQRQVVRTIDQMAAFILETGRPESSNARTLFEAEPTKT
jgi:hypothetical protein